MTPLELIKVFWCIYDKLKASCFISCKMSFCRPDRHVHTWVRVNGSALKQDSGSPVGQGPIDTVTVSCYPANICHTAEHVPVMVAEHILVMRGKIDGTVELKKRSRYDI